MEKTEYNNKPMTNRISPCLKCFHIVAVFICVILLSCKENKPNFEKKQPVRVVATHPSTSLGASGLRYVGVVEELSSTAVSFTGSGLITRMDVDEGQYVRKGQLIAQLDTTQATNVISNARAQLNQARDAYKRMKDMYDEGALPEIKFMEVQTQLEQAEAMYDAAVKSKRDCMVYAPITGVVGKKILRVGETALPAQSVCTILDISHVKVRVGVPEKEFSTILSSTPTNIYIEALNLLVSGGRIEKGISADLATHTYDILIHLNNPERSILPGMICKVEVLATNTSEIQNVSSLSVPVKSVCRASNGEMFVWIIKNGKSRRQPVVVGDAIGNNMEICSGLTPGDLVITEGYQKVADGTSVVDISQ